MSNVNVTACRMSPQTRENYSAGLFQRGAALGAAFISLRPADSGFSKNKMDYDRVGQLTVGLFVLIHYPEA